MYIDTIYTNLYNLCPSCNRYSPVGRSFYSPDIGRRQPLGEGLESWRGFYQSIRPTQMGLSLNIGLCFSFLYLVLFLIQ